MIRARPTLELAADDLSHDRPAGAGPPDQSSRRMRVAPRAEVGTGVKSWIRQARLCGDSGNRMALADCFSPLAEDRVLIYLMPGSPDR
jgi:hypothetical protein